MSAANNIPQIVADFVCHTGEAPLWHPHEQRLYWVDIPQARLLRYDPATESCDTFDTHEPVGGMTVQPDGALLMFMARGAIKLWRDGKWETVIDELAEEADNRFNDVIADPAGRVFCGTLSTVSRAGRLYRLDPDRTIRPVLDGIGTSNGLGFSLDGKHMYYTDTRRHEIYLFDYDQSSGNISGQRVFVKVDEGESRPDGLTVDAEGCVWSARWAGGCIVRYAPDGAELMRVEAPGAINVTSLTFGGPDYTDIYITTAGGGNRPEFGQSAGALFRMNPGIRGRPEFCSRI